MACRRAILGSLMLLFLSLPALPQDLDLRLRSSYGFDGVVRPGEWNPLYVSLTNLGDRVAALMSLDVIVSPGAPNNETVLVVEEEIELGKGESLTRRFTVPVARGSLPLRLRLVSSGTILLNEEILPPLRYTPEKLVVALSSGALKMAPGLPVAYPLLEHLPESWHGWSPVDLAILATPPLERLSPAQWNALKEWVRFGGRVLLAGASGSPASEAQLRTLWESGADDPRAGEWGESVTSRKLGDGTIFRATRPEEVTSREIRDLAERDGVTGKTPPLESSRRPFTDSAVAALVEHRVYRYPSRWLMAALFATAAVSLSLLTRRGPDSPRMALLSPILLPLSFAAILAVLFGTTAAPPADLALEIQRAEKEESGSGSFRLQRDVMVMTSRAREFGVVLPRGTVFLPNQGRRNRVQIERTGDLAIRGALEEWDRHFLSTWERRYVDLSAELIPGEEEVRIRNGEKLLLRESAVITGWHTFSAGAVSPGQDARRPLEEGSEDDLSGEARRYINELRKERELRDALRDGTIFVGWTSTVAEAYQLQGAFDRQLVTAVIIIPMEGSLPR